MELDYQISEIEKIAENILASVPSKILLFYGSMGAGKTTLIKAMVHHLGSTDIASSPTFSLVNEYETPEGPIFHFDFYRIEEEMEAMDIGFEDYLEQEGWIFIEWPQKIPNLLPDNAVKIQLSVKDNSSRSVKVLLTK